MPERAQRYRAHAARLREVARDVANPKTRALLETMARDWEHVADAVPQQESAAGAKPDPPGKRPG
jgi:hypothetical protein